jgi:hypothetical protein
MIILSIILVLLSNAVNIRRDISILFNRIAILILIYCILHDISSLAVVTKGVGLHGGLLLMTNITQIFHIFIFLVSILILQLTSFYPRKVWVSEYSSLKDLLLYKFIYYNTKIINKMGEHFKIIEYPLIILFVITGAVLLMSTNDLVSIFLAIELQSYGLYILSTIYRNSELSTTGGLIYFLLGGLSSCFILLGTSLLYANSGTTNLDGLYIITSISDLSTNLWYTPYYINLSLVIFTIGFLFKVSAAPFHFWSPKKGLRKSLSTYVGCKLSNSGEPLKLLVLSHIWKYMSGWINYSGIVTSQKMSENKMGNRGSKSTVFKNTVVKEQRVNGSWCGINLPHLRCTLLGFERSYLVKILSNQIIQRQFYSSESNLDNNQLPQDPWFISGFSDAEGCFLVLVRKSPKSKLGWQIEANFTINLHVRDLDLLKLIQTYFGVGRIGKERNGCRDFTIGSLDQIITKVIPHFDKYPLKTNKYSDYLLFKQVVMMMQRGEHLTAEGLQKIISIRASLNRGLTPLLLEAFPNTVALVRPLLPPLNRVKLDPQWVAGFTSGDGCFKVSIRESKLHKTGSRVVLLFVVTQHIRDELLLKSLVDFFGCGQTYSYKDYIEFRCQSFKDNYEKILPFFDKYPIIGVKSEDFKDWAKVAKMIQTKVHLTNEGFDQIRQIRTGMNKGRYLK